MGQEPEKNLMSERSISAQIKAFALYEPELWKILYPRAYMANGNYGSPKLAAYAMGSCCCFVRTRTHEANDMERAERSLYGAACIAARNDMPVFFIANELLQAVLRSSPPLNLLWAEMQLPFEAATFCLPKSALISAGGFAMDLLGWARIRKDSVFRLTADYPEFAVHQDTLIVWGSALKEEQQFQFISSVDNLKYPHIDDWEDRGYLNEIASEDGSTTKLSVSESSFLDQCRRLIFAILLAIKARPTLITPATRITKAISSSARETWSPNIIGKDYKIQREIGQHPHSSPRMHWRRGHFRQQHYGIRSSETKIIWLEPMLIGMLHENRTDHQDHSHQKLGE